MKLLRSTKSPARWLSPRAGARGPRKAASPMPSLWSLLYLRSPPEPRTAAPPPPTPPPPYQGVPRPQPACKLSRAPKPHSLPRELTIAPQGLRRRQAGRPAGESVTGIRDPFAPTTSPSKWKEVEAAALGDDVKKRAASLQPSPEAGSATWAPAPRGRPAGRSHREEQRDCGPRSELRRRLLARAPWWRCGGGFLGEAG